MTRRRQRIFVGLTIGALAAAVGPLLSNPVTAHAETACGTTDYRDLNRDGFEDAVVGDPYATVDGQAEAGTVTVLFGDADCRIGEGARRTLTQADLGETPEAGDHFGWSVMLNKTDIGGEYGMVIGSPGEDIGAATDAGTAHILTFAPLFEEDPDADWRVNLTQGDVGGTVETGDAFGYSVTARGGSDEYPVVFGFGAPGENVGEGVVNITNSYTLGRTGVQVRQGSRGLPGKPQAGDRFGHVIAFIPVNIGAPSPADDDGLPLFVGAPGDVVAGHGRAGSVTAMWVDPVGTFQEGAGRAPATLITQDSPTIPGVAEAGDQFGYSLADNTRRPGPDQDLIAIGSPGEDLGSLANAGSVTVLRNVGSTLRNRITFTQRTAGIPGVAEAGDRFGSAVSFRDERELLIGAPGEDVGAIREAGAAQIVRIGKSHISTPYASITENSPGTPGIVRAGNHFGSSVSGLPDTDSWQRNPPATGYGEKVFTISSEVQDGGSVYVISSDPKVAPRSWQPGTGGIPGVGVRFGHSVG